MRSAIWLPALLLVPLAASEAAARQASARPTVCTMEYLPVCGFKAGRWRTFTSPCFARAAGARRIRIGACRR